MTARPVRHPRAQKPRSRWALGAAFVALAVVGAGCGGETVSTSEGAVKSTSEAAVKSASPTEKSRPAVRTRKQVTRVVHTTPTPAAAAPAAARAAAPVLKTARRYRVIRVVDGDTVHVAYHGDTTIRLIGIDTPETVSPSVPDECGGRAASNVAHELLDGKQVTVQLDPSQGRFDRYGRTLAYLGVPGVGDYGLAMIRRGRAAEYTYGAPYRRQQAYRAAEARAKAHEEHLWRQCGGTDTPLEATPAPAPTSRATAPSGGGSTCEPGYSPCLPVTDDLDCSDVSGPVTVTGDDPYRLDADGDGTGCDS